MHVHLYSTYVPLKNMIYSLVPTDLGNKSSLSDFHILYLQNSETYFTHAAMMAQLEKTSSPEKQKKEEVTQRVQKIAGLLFGKNV